MNAKDFGVIVGGIAAVFGAAMVRSKSSSLSEIIREFSESLNDCPSCGCPTEAGTMTDLRTGQTKNYRSCDCCAECYWRHTWEKGTPEPTPDF